MPQFLFIFGFETPHQARNNDLHGWDDEDSEGLLIDADDEAAALAWGNHVAERFLDLLYRDSGTSWRDRYHFELGWIVRSADPETDVWDDQQRVAVGEVPDFRPWLEKHWG